MSFPNSILRRKFLYVSVALTPGNEKNISTWYQDAKESTNKGGHFLDFQGFSWSYAGPKFNLHPRTEILTMVSLTPKSSIWKYVFLDTNYNDFLYSEQELRFHDSQITNQFLDPTNLKFVKLPFSTNSFFQNMITLK